MRQAGGDGGAAAPGGGVGLGQHQFAADGFDGVMRAAGGGRLDHGYRVFAARVDHMGGAELPRQFQLGRQHVDGDDGMGAGSVGAEQGGQADPAQAEHCDTLAGGDMGRIDHRADAGHHRAAEQRRDLRRQVGVDLDRRARRNHGHLGETRHAQVVVQGTRAVAMPVALAGQQGTGGIRRRARLAQGGAPAGAGIAVAAGRDEGKHHLVARLEVGHTVTALDYFASGFMAEHHRHHPRARTVDHRQVGMAQAGGAHPHQQFAGTGRVQLQGLDAQRPGLGIGRRQAHFTQHRAAHCESRHHAGSPATSSRSSAPRSGPEMACGRRSARSTKTCTNQPSAAGASAPARNSPIS